MNSLLLAVIIFSAQLLVVIAVAGMAEALCRVTDPWLRSAYWRGVALACLLLPLWAIAGPETSASGVTLRAVTFLAASLESAESIPVPTVRPAAGAVVWWVLSVGALARLGWLCMGGMRLRLLRQRSQPTVLTPDLEAIRSQMAPRAEFRISSEIAQPAAFGLRHPVVLLPERFFALDPQARRTVACHELLHVARRDWPWIVIEEVARAVFWFHPAVWWLVEQIQESREQLVDRLVIARVPSKRAYMAALLAFADGARRPVALASAFLRRRHLRSRLRMLGKESVMSRRRLVWTAMVLGCVMTSAIAGTVMALPLGSPIGEADTRAQEVVDGKAPGVTMPKLITEVRPQYTPEALQARIQGTILLTVVVQTDGMPTDIEITQSLDTEYGLDDQAVAALGQWRFEPGLKDGKPVPVRIDIEVRFRMK